MTSNPAIAMPTASRARETLEAGRVARYHAAPSVQPQTDGLHAWGVLVLVLFITGGRASRELLLESAMHDTGELYAGDIPFTAMRDDKVLYDHVKEIEDAAREFSMLVPRIDLCAMDLAVLKLADTIEGFIWCTKTERGTLIRDRWLDSFVVGVNKYRHTIPNDYAERALAVVHAHGGIIHPSSIISREAAIA